MSTWRSVRTRGIRGITGLGGLVLLVIGVVGCDSNRPNEQRLNGGGSSFVYPMMSKWASVYARESGVQVNYQSIGSGGGIQQVLVKSFDFGCTDAPMNDEQLQRARATGGDVIHVPLILGAVVPAYRLHGIEQPLRFSGPVLADIFLGSISKWNAPAIQRLNPDVALPDQAIAVVYRSDGSGTTFIWSEYLSKVSADWNSRVGVGTSLHWPIGVGQKGNEGVAAHIARSPGAIGYIELTYALQNNIQYGSVHNREGVFIPASLKSVTAAAEAVLPRIPDDLRFSLTDQPGKNSYPISGTVWAVIYMNQPASKGESIMAFLRWVTHEGQQYAQDLHYVPLPEGLVKRVEQKLALIKLGN